MNAKENFMVALNHQIPEFVPLYVPPTRFVVGLSDWFEKGPKNGGLDGFGVKWITTVSADGMPTPDPGGALFEDIEDWHEFVHFPDLDAIDWEKKAKEELKGYNPKEQVLEYCVPNGSFERLMALMGFGDALCALYENPEECAEFFKELNGYKMKYIEKIAQYYHPDIITHFDDVAYADNLLFPKETYQAYIKPFHKEFNDRVKEYGMIPVQHCCGKAESLIEDFIEEGAVAWTSVEPINDIEGLLQKYGSQITLIGGFRANGTAGQVSATEEERRQEVRDVFDQYAKYGSFIFGNFRLLIGSDDPNEAERIMGPILDEANKYGKYFYR